jgi:hypothetical protein
VRASELPNPIYEKAAKDVEKLAPRLRDKLKVILRNQIALDPFAGKPLVGELY